MASTEIPIETTATITPAAIGAAATNASTTGTSGGVAATAGTANSVVLANATSGTITIQATTGALGSVTLTAPATTGTLALTSQIPAAQVAANLASSGSTGVTGQLPIGQVGSAGLSASNGVNIASAGAISLTYGTTANTVAQGNDSRIVNAAQCTAGTSAGNCLTLNGSGLVPVANLPAAIDTRTVTVTDVGPVTADDGLSVVLDSATAVHLTRISCGVTGTTSVIINLVKATVSLIADMTATAGDVNTVVQTTWANGSSQCGGTTSCAVAAHTPVTLHIGTISGTPTSVSCSLDYTID